MKNKGIRISDIIDGKCISLCELLLSIPDISSMNWSLLWLDAVSVKNEGEIIMKLQTKTNNSQDGLPCTFESLIEVSKKVFQEIEILIIGCKNKVYCHRYKDDQEMYETCDITIEMIDGGYWEIFSKNIDWINYLASRYTEVEFIDTDFQKSMEIS